MTVEEYLQMEVEDAREEAKKEGREEGREEGRKEGEARFSQLVACMMENGESRYLTALCSDSVYLKKMYEKYNL